MKRAMRVCAGVLGVLVAGGAVWAEGTGVPFKLEIGRETTRVSGPVMTDGTIDYGAALWGEMSKGVTAENNAAPLLKEAGEKWTRYAHGVSDEEYGRLDGELRKAQGGPWRTEEFPEVAAWLKANEDALVLVVAASERTRLCPAPPAAGEAPNLAKQMELGKTRDFANALLARAMLRMGTGDYAGGRGDIAAMHGIAKLLSEVPDLLGFMVGEAISDLAERGELAVVRTVGREEGRKWLALRQARPEMRLGVAAVDVGVRYQDLDYVMMVLRGKGGEVMEALTFLNVESLFTGKSGEAPRVPGDLGEVDWNIVLRRINAVDDEVVGLMKEGDARKRVEGAKRFSARLEAEDVPGNLFSDVMGKAMLKDGPPSGEGIESEMKRYRAELVGKIETFLKRRPGESVEAFSDRMGRFFTHSSSSLNRSLEMDSKHSAWHVVYATAMALEVCKKENGAYPDRLERLVPGYLAGIPVDVFSGGALIYRREGKGYVVYSVGPNGVDDGGEHSMGKDDVAVQSAEK